MAPHHDNHKGKTCSNCKKENDQGVKKKHSDTQRHQNIGKGSNIRNKEKCIYKPANNEQNGSNKSFPINNNFT